MPARPSSSRCGRWRRSQRQEPDGRWRGQFCPGAQDARFGVSAGQPQRLCEPAPIAATVTRAIDAGKAKAEENLDGKYLLRTSDPKLSAEDIALGYRQLLQVERGWRDMKQVIDLRPVYHRKEERIRAHVILCWLALLLARIAENATGDTWPQLRRQLDRIAVGTFTGPAGTFRQRTEISPAQATILEQLGIDPPPKIYQLTPAASG